MSTPSNVAQASVAHAKANRSRSARATIALDAMGGDHAPHVVVEGAAKALKRFPNLKFRLFGDERLVAPLLSAHPQLAAAVTLIHTDTVVKTEDKPSAALRQGAKSSMRLAINDVSEGHAQAIVSGGNTGALMAMSKFVFRTLPGVDRPAISSMLPTMAEDIVMLDMGANLECSPRNLLEFAVMGEAFCRAVLGREKPTVGILNVGSEESKGPDSLRQAAEMIRASRLAGQFKGFVEGNDIGKGTVDVVVTDGFTGNIALKVTEGTARFCVYELKQAFKSNLLGRIVGAMSWLSLRAMKRNLNPSLRNGGMFLGLNGVAIKSHGGADAEGFANAIGVAVHIVEHRLNEKIIEDLRAIGHAGERVAASEHLPA